MESVEAKMAAYIKGEGLKIKTVAEKAGVPYSKLQPALNGMRQMRVDEFLNVCQALNVEPEIFRPGESLSA